MSDTNKAEKILIVGAGQMGTGIAHAFALAGYPVALVDQSQDALDLSISKIKSILAGGVRLKKVSQADADRAIRLITRSQDLESSARGADLVIETASEKIAIKHEIVRVVDAVVSATAVIATNTSALGITEIAAASTHPGRVIGMHFFNPVHIMKLVEIIPGLMTDQATTDKVAAWCKVIEKTSTVVKDSPGFVTTRMSVMLGNEAMYMLAEGLASAEDIDTSFRLGFSHPMGPLELGDLTGWDTRLSVLKYLHKTLGEKFRPCPLIIKMVESGRFGRKVGHGVYNYADDGSKIPGSGLKDSL